VKKNNGRDSGHHLNGKMKTPSSRGGEVGYSKKKVTCLEGKKRDQFQVEWGVRQGGTFAPKKKKKVGKWGGDKGGKKPTGLTSKGVGQETSVSLQWNVKSLGQVMT